MLIGPHASALLGSAQLSLGLQVLGPATGPWTVNKTARPVVVMAAKFQMEVSQRDPVAGSFTCCVHGSACAPLSSTRAVVSLAPDLRKLRCTDRVCPCYSGQADVSVLHWAYVWLMPAGFL